MSAGSTLQRRMGSLKRMLAVAGLLYTVGLLARGRAVTFVEDASRGIDEARTTACLAAWREGGTEQTLRVHLSRLRRRLVPIGLAMQCGAIEM